MSKSTDNELKISAADQKIRDQDLARYIEEHVKQGRMGCEGITEPCRHCGIKLNWLNGNPIEYVTGQIHRCKWRRATNWQMH